MSPRLMPAQGAAASDEPDMASIGTLLSSVSATDMAGYANIEAVHSDFSSVPHFHPYHVTVDTSQLSLVSPGRLGSGKILRLDYPGSDQQGEEIDAYPYFTGIADNTAMYFQYYGRFGFTSGGWNGESINFKHWMFWWKNSGSRTQFNTRFAIHDNPDLSGKDTYWELLDTLEVPPGSGCDSQNPIGPYFQDLFDGQWHRFTAAIKTNNSASPTKDGFQRLWIDGAKVIDRSQSAVGVTPSGGTHPYCTQYEVDHMTEDDSVQFVMWGGVQTNNPDGSQDSNPWHVEIDNFIARAA